MLCGREQIITCVVCVVQVIAYLFAQKVLCPDKMILIRGNHEVRDVQLYFTFKT